MEIFFLGVDSLSKTFSCADAGAKIVFVLNLAGAGAKPAAGDRVLGYISQGIDEFQLVFEVRGVKANCVELEKRLECSPGVAAKDYASELAPYVGGLLNGGDILLPDKLVGKKIMDQLMKDGDRNGSSYDKLTAALKLFQKFRATRQISPWSSFDAYAKAVRSEFGLVDESLVGSQGFDYGVYMRKYAITPTVANAQFAGHSTDVQKAVLKFLHDEKNAPHDAAWYIDENNRPKHNGANIAGFGPTATVFFMMELRPEKFATWSKMVFDSLRDLGLYVGQTPTVLTQESYEYSFAQQVLLKSKMKEMGIGKAADDQSDADFLTVNEFLWFVSENFQEIKNMAKQMQQKTVTQNRTAGNNDWSKLPNDNPDSLMYRLAASLLTRPFAILAGASGTGKSRMVKKLACMTCYDDDLKPDAAKPLGNYQMIQVKPSWHDSSELLGYRSMLNPDANIVDYKSTDFVRFVLKAHAYPNTPFFVCLDEMNLAPVEQYFAEFLSACESVEKKEIKGGNGQVTESFYVTNPLIPPTEYNDDIENIGLEYPLDQKVKDRLNKFGLYIPRNLFVVGTVNMDDTTCQFSRKVLDRAMTIEMNEVKFDTLKDPEELIVTGTNGLLMKEDQIKAFVERKDFDKETLDSDFLALLEKIQEIVKPTPFAVGYRFALETSMYREALKAINAEKMAVDKIDPNTNQPEIDPATNQPKKVDVSGVYALDHMILTKILPRITGNKVDREKLTDALDGYFKDKLKDHKLSADALEGMLTRAGDNGGYLSFWP